MTIEIRVKNVLKFLSEFEDKFDLLFADPPWNVGKDYYVVSDNRANYFSWCEEWIKKGFKSLKKGGVFYLINNPENCHVLYSIMNKYGIYRSSIVWFKRCSPAPRQKGYPNMYSTILFFTKGQVSYFNQSERIQFELQTRGNVSDHVPYDVWLDIPKIVAGRFSEEYVVDLSKTPILLNQLPVSLLKRIIKISVPENGWVCDPFCGTGTTARACKILNRNFIGCDINEELVKIAIESLKTVDKEVGVINLEEYFSGEKT